MGSASVPANTPRLGTRDSQLKQAMLELAASSQALGSAKTPGSVQCSVASSVPPSPAVSTRATRAPGGGLSFVGSPGTSFRDVSAKASGPFLAPPTTAPFRLEKVPPVQVPLFPSSQQLSAALSQQQLSGGPQAPQINGPPRCPQLSGGPRCPQLSGGGGLPPQQLSGVPPLSPVPSAQQLNAVPLGNGSGSSGVPPTQPLGAGSSAAQLNKVRAKQQVSVAPPTQQLKAVPKIQGMQCRAPFTPTSRTRDIAPSSGLPSSLRPTPKQTPRSTPKPKPGMFRVPGLAPKAGTTSGATQGGPRPSWAISSFGSATIANTVKEKLEIPSPSPRERRHSNSARSEREATFAQQNTENRMASIQENSTGKSLQDPHTMGTAPPREYDEENDLSDRGVRLQEKLAMLASSDRRVL